MVDLSTPCIPWHGTAHPKGYGVLKLDGKRWLAHRLALVKASGLIPAGMVVDHACHNADEACAGGVTCPHRRCVNPDHLEAITPAESNRRGRVNATKTTCKHGHPFSEANTYVPARGSRECRACNAQRASSRLKARRTATV